MILKQKTGAIGATIDGLELSEPTPKLKSILTDALDRHLVVKVPSQDLDRFQLSKLGSLFGDHFFHPLVSNGYEDCPEVLELLREPNDDNMFGGENWHTDISWLKPGGHISILHGIELPETGGDTAFSSTIATFERLSAGLQDLLRGLNAVHAYNWYERREVDPWVVEHPVVRCHPVTGREGLFVNRMFTSRFSGMTVEESAGLLEFLFDRMEQHEVTCRFEWAKGDVLLWDNRFTLHYPINDFSGQTRRMIRTSTIEAEA